MSTIEFMKYEPTPGERHFGIATVRLYGKIILRYKIVPTKDGSSFFPAAASYKMPGSNGTEDHYIAAFMLDSNCDREELEAVIRAQVRPYLTQTPNQPVGALGGPLQSAGAPSTQAMSQSPNNPYHNPPQSQANYWDVPPPQAQQEFPGFSGPPSGGMPF